MKRLIGLGFLALIIVLGLLQLVPYGRNHSNPVVSEEPAWDSAQTRALVARTCFDCHSNETVWPWYSHIAPASWLMQRDVDEGRGHLNFSEWDRGRQEADEAVEVVQEGEMPPWFYLPLHPEARLSAEEKAALIEGLRATLGTFDD